MIGSGFGYQVRRRNEEKNKPSALSGLSASQNAANGPTFAAEMGVQCQAHQSGMAAAPGLWKEAVGLALAGGGTAKTTLSLDSGEKVEIRVSVRNGRVTVLAQVRSFLGESAVKACQDKIASALTESGLKLHRFHIRRQPHGQRAEKKQPRQQGRDHHQRDSQP